jgi:tetratricopeptide (TPR) repeat protein
MKWIKMTRFTASWPVAALMGLWLSPIAAHPVLMFTVTSHKEPPPGMQSSSGQVAKPSDETFPLAVTLGHRYLLVQAHGTRTIYDFERRRILRVNEAGKSYTDASLYADIGARAMEFQNRINLGSALKAGKVSMNTMEPALMEQLFSMSSPIGQSTIDQRRGSDASVFFFGEQLLMRVSDRTQELPAEYQAEYWRFLRYYAGIHPKIYAALAARRGVPQDVTLVLTNMTTETRKMTLSTIRNDPDAPYSLEGLILASPSEAPYSTLKLLGPDAAAQLAIRKASTMEARDAAFAQGHVLDALLANLAIMIMSDDATSTTEWLAKHRDDIQGDESSRALTANLTPRDQAAAQAAVQVLSELHKQPGTATYMLDLFEGNTLLSLRDTRGGAQHLLAALQVNPYLLGAWKDLGGSYYQSFEADKAWACWDAARRVSPRHSMLLQITELEERLRAGFPEFF